ncbi:MAG: hypothetical protein OEV30_02865 [Ignavibacteria bacterium]|nr:hypothetical protein [Ignavibacteria bacterium]
MFIFSPSIHFFDFRRYGRYLPDEASDDVRIPIHFDLTDDPPDELFLLMDRDTGDPLLEVEDEVRHTGADLVDQPFVLFHLLDPFLLPPQVLNLEFNFLKLTHESRGGSMLSDCVSQVPGRTFKDQDRTVDGLLIRRFSGG